MQELHEVPLWRSSAKPSTLSLVTKHHVATTSHLNTSSSANLFFFDRWTSYSASTGMKVQALETYVTPPLRHFTRTRLTAVTAITIEGSPSWTSLYARHPPQQAAVTQTRSLFGFRTGRSTTDMTFSLRQLQKKSRVQSRPLYIMFIDLTKVFDLFSRKGLFELPKNIDCPPETPQHGNLLPWTVLYDGTPSGSFPIDSGYGSSNFHASLVL